MAAKRKHSPRGLGRQKHHCSACDSTKHRIENCESKAAAIIRKLKEEIQKLTKPKNYTRKLIRRLARPQEPTKSGKYKEETKRMCSGKSAKVRKQWGREGVGRVERRKQAERERDRISTPAKAHESLIHDGFCWRRSLAFIVRKGS